MTTALLATLALASPGGFRAPTVVPTQVVEVRENLVIAPGAYGVSQTTLALQGAYDPVALQVQVPLVHAWDDGWSETGTGQMRVGVRLWAAPQQTAWKLAIGPEIAFPYAPPVARMTSWAASSRDVLASVEVLVVTEFAIPSDAPVSLRLGLGWQWGPWMTGTLMFNSSLPAAELVVAKAVPLTGPLSFVAEFEAAIDLTPLQVRTLARLDAGEHVSVDLGLQLPVVEYLNAHFSFQPVAGVRARF